MPVVQAATKVIAKRLPKVVNPRAHAVLDYVTAGAFLALGVMCWSRNKRASVGAFLCGAATAANAMLTDYPGGVTKVISYPTHGQIDAGLAGLAATMPNIFAFQEEDEAKYFRGLALAETIITGLTDFEADSKVIEMPHYDRAIG